MMLSLNEILGQLGLIVIKEQVQLDFSFWTNCLELILCQEVGRLFPALISTPPKPHTLLFTSPVRLYLNDPVDI